MLEEITEVKIDLKNASQLALFVQSERKEQHVTQIQLAQLSNVGVRFIRDLEDGKETLQLDKVLRVLDTLGSNVTLSSATGEELWKR
ncbi:MAG: helix-turn-helix domain-containing protein [Kiritimatiellia bacterium]